MRVPALISKLKTNLSGFGKQQKLIYEENRVTKVSCYPPDL